MVFPESSNNDSFITRASSHSSKRCHSKHDQDVSMKPPENGLKYPRIFNERKQSQILESILELFKVEQWIQIAQLF